MLSLMFRRSHGVAGGKTCWLHDYPCFQEDGKRPAENQEPSRWLRGQPDLCSLHCDRRYMTTTDLRDSCPQTRPQGRTPHLTGAAFVHISGFSVSPSKASLYSYSYPSGTCLLSATLCFKSFSREIRLIAFTIQ